MKSFISFLILFISICSCSNQGKEVVRSVHPNGKPEVIEYINQDSIVEKRTEFWLNGKKSLEGSFNKNNRREGIWNAWYENGNLWSTGKFINGKSNGTFFSYNEDGTLYQESNYKEGIPHGKWTYYKDNEIIKEVFFDNGNVVNEL